MAALDASEDRYGGVVVQLDAVRHGNMDPAEFGVQLHAALEGWRQQGKRGIWLRVPAKVANLVDPAIMLGFDFHHAQPGHVVLTKWLPATPSSLPAYPHHQLGVGGLVLDASGAFILCIQERSGVTAGMQDFWKLPGGLVDPGEDLSAAAVREVREETGVETVFDCIAAVREMQGGPFGCADLYAVCVLRLSDSYGPSNARPTPVPQESEIAAAEWRNLEELLSSRYYAKGLYGALIRTAAGVAHRRRRGEAIGLQASRMKGLGGAPESLYYAGGEVLARAKL